MRKKKKEKKSMMRNPMLDIWYDIFVLLFVNIIWKLFLIVRFYQIQVVL